MKKQWWSGHSDTQPLPQHSQAFRLSTSTANTSVRQWPYVPGREHRYSQFKTKPEMPSAPPGLSSIAFSTLSSILCTLPLVLQKMRSEVNVRGFRLSLQDQKSTWLAVVVVVQQCEYSYCYWVRPKTVSGPSGTCILPWQENACMYNTIRVFISVFCLQRLVHWKTACLMSMARRLLIKPLPWAPGWLVLACVPFSEDAWGLSCCHAQWYRCTINRTTLVSGVWVCKNVIDV